MHRPLLLGLALVLAGGGATLHSAPSATLTLERAGHWLVVHGPQLPGDSFRINYLEAYCRAASADADWRKHTVIAHHSELLALSADRRVLRLRDTLADGVIVEHTITARADEVDFQLVARNPGAQRSEAHWAQPCVRLSRFTGHDENTAANATDYLPQCFIFLDGRLTRMPTRNWATTARYIPGQVWCPAHVPRTDVNPRPLSPLVPDNGLIGCTSGDGKLMWATAWEPYYEGCQSRSERCAEFFLKSGLCLFSFLGGAGFSKRDPGL